MRLALLLSIGVWACSEKAPESRLTPGDASVLDAEAPDVFTGLDDASTSDGTTLDASHQDATPVDAGTVDAQVVVDAGTLDPLAPRPKDPDALTDVSADLEALLENGALPGACDAYQADPGNRRKKLLCGKSMFFLEGFGTIGIPEVLVRFFAKEFPNELGLAYEKLGLVRDPYSADPMPLGFAPGAPAGDDPTMAFTCASCHFARLPDGRYAVGAPNLQYEYGRHILSMTLPPSLLSPGANASDHHADAVARVQPVIDKIQNDRALRIRLLASLLSLVGAPQPPVDPEVEGNHAHWLSGTMDFLVTPLPIDDEVHTISKILALWDIPSRAQLQGQSARLAWTGGAEALQNFLDGFVRIGGGDRTIWTAERLEPLVEYIETLRAPQNPSPPNATAITAGRAAYQAAGCPECHDGPSGSGDRIYTFEEIGTDPALRDWGSPDATGRGCCGLQEAGQTLTRGLKSPRLTGSWVYSRFLHNGSIPSLEMLLCVDPRPASEAPPFANTGHLYGCDRPESERRAIVDFLKSI